MREISMIDEWLFRNRDASQRLSSRIGTILDEISASNPLTRAFTLVLDGPARSRSRRLDHYCAADADQGAQHLPLLGVPVAIKDNIDIAGTTTSCGSIVLSRPPALANAAVVQQLELAGAIVLGKTNLDEAALGASGRNDHFGRCLNPTAAETLSGGSSGGSAAAVAAGHALLAIGTDTLGSVRIPAALCGVSGFKPSYGRIDSHGVAPLYPSFDTVGFIARGIEELTCAAWVLRLTSVNEPAKKRACTIWVLGASHLADADLNISAAYRHRLLALDQCNWIRVRELPAFDFVGISRAALWEVANSFGSKIGFSDAAFEAQREMLGMELHQILSRAATLTADKLEVGRLLLRTARTDLLRYLSEADAIFTPTCPIASLPVSAALPKTIAAFVAVANVAGLPAVCWPETAGSPQKASWQLIGRPGKDQELLQLASAISRIV
jgi:aspartyl-tRNA(Asn)/glutamyl-tRNA(Gln) amidotransferase subunit A